MRRRRNAVALAFGLLIVGMVVGAVEFFNLVLGTQLTPEDKQDLVAFLRAL